jgi:hypothetical protein
MGRWEQTDDGGWVWADNAYYDPLRDDQEAEQASFRDEFPRRVYYDCESQQYRCHCSRYRATGKCHHLVRYRVTRNVEVDERYL